MSKKELCPICGTEAFEHYGSYDICPLCGWEDDRVQMKFPDETGANGDWTLNTAKKAWAEGKTLHPKWPHP